MQTLVIYDTKFGNTRQIADAIARGAATRGAVSVLHATEAAVPLEAAPDLVVIGGPTQRRGLSPELRAFVDALPAGLRGIPSATFDTRYRGSTWIMGSAAAEAARRLGRAGSRFTASPESFYIARGGPLERQGLEPGELARAEAWGRAVGAAVPTREP